MTKFFSQWELSTECHTVISYYLVGFYSLKKTPREIFLHCDLISRDFRIWEDLCFFSLCAKNIQSWEHWQNFPPLSTLLFFHWVFLLKVYFFWNVIPLSMMLEKCFIFPLLSQKALFILNVFYGMKWQFESIMVVVSRQNSSTFSFFFNNFFIVFTTSFITKLTAEKYLVVFLDYCWMCHSFVVWLVKQIIFWDL